MGSQQPQIVIPTQAVCGNSSSCVVRVVASLQRTTAEVSRLKLTYTSKTACVTYLSWHTCCLSRKMQPCTKMQCKYQRRAEIRVSQTEHCQIDGITCPDFAKCTNTTRVSFYFSRSENSAAKPLREPSGATYVPSTRRGCQCIQSHKPAHAEQAQAPITYTHLRAEDTALPAMRPPPGTKPDAASSAQTTLRTWRHLMASYCGENCGVAGLVNGNFTYPLCLHCQPSATEQPNNDKRRPAEIARFVVKEWNKGEED